MKKIVESLKMDFREWYGLLSVDEIINNHKLIRAIESTEQVIEEFNINPK